MPDFTHVSWIAVIVAAVVQIVIGYVWYMPTVFGKRWEAATGKTLPTGMPAPMALGMMVIGALLAAYGLALYFGGGGLVNGAEWGLLTWLYFMAAPLAGVVVFEGRSWNWWLVVAGYWLVGMIVMGAIVGYFTV